MFAEKLPMRKLREIVRLNSQCDASRGRARVWYFAEHGRQVRSTRRGGGIVVAAATGVG